MVSLTPSFFNSMISSRLRSKALPLFLILAVLAIVCAGVLTVEGVVLLSGPTLQARGWRFGVHFLLGSLVALPWRRGCMTFMPS